MLSSSEPSALSDDRVMLCNYSSHLSSRALFSFSSFCPSLLLPPFYPHPMSTFHLRIFASSTSPGLRNTSLHLNAITSTRLRLRTMSTLEKHIIAAAEPFDRVDDSTFSEKFDRFQNARLVLVCCTRVLLPSLSLASLHQLYFQHPKRFLSNMQLSFR